MNRGFTLIETTVAAAILAIAAVALFAAFSASARVASYEAAPARAAASLLARNIARDAQQSWKYGSPGTAPSGSFSTAMPWPAGVNVSLSNAGPEGAH